jgi:predicted RNA binding protein YcfA (HicA-like mRNA interferase family)
MAGGGLPVVKGRQVIRALERAGFVVERIVGSHHILVHPGDATRTVTVPVHANRDIKPGTLRSIVRQAGLTVDEFKAFL